MKIYNVAALAAAIGLSMMVPSLQAQPVPPEQQRREEEGKNGPDRGRDEDRNKGSDHAHPHNESERGQGPDPDRNQRSEGRAESPRRPDGRTESQDRPGNVHPNNDSRGRGDRGPDDRGPDSQRQRPPADFSDVRRIVHEHRQSIGRGPAVPSHVRIVKGKPMPPGWGKRLTEAQLRPLPRYPGYEWRRVGADMILVEVSTAIVVEILVGVLD